MSALWTVPNAITLSRLALTPAMAGLAWTGHPQGFLIALVVSLGSDVIDGVIARWLNQTSALGARLDSWADLSVYTVGPLCVWHLHPDLVRSVAPAFGAMVIAYVLPVVLGFLKFRALTSYHTLAARAGAVTVGLGSLILLAGGPRWPFVAATGLLVGAELEEIAITLTLPRLVANVPSWWAARRIRNSGVPCPAAKW